MAVQTDLMVIVPVKEILFKASFEPVWAKADFDLIELEKRVPICFSHQRLVIQEGRNSLGFDIVHVEKAQCATRFSIAANLERTLDSQVFPELKSGERRPLFSSCFDCRQSSSGILLAVKVCLTGLSRAKVALLFVSEFSERIQAKSLTCRITDCKLIEDNISCKQIEVMPFSCTFAVKEHLFCLNLRGNYSYSLFSVAGKKIVQVYSSRGKRLVTGGSADTTIVRWNDEKKRLIISHLDVDRSVPHRPLLRLSRLVYAVRF
jgi:hypothetical protein